MAEQLTTADGEFELEGEESEVGWIDPRLKVFK